MALHVTQCPSCDSTFNTSARVLDSAHGLVRCGACLSVFEANANFVKTLPPASNDDMDHDEDHSVFISGQEDYFDPTSFLKRSELRDHDDADQGVTVEKDPDHEPEDLEIWEQDPGEMWTIVDYAREAQDTDQQVSAEDQGLQPGLGDEDTFIEMPASKPESPVIDLDLDTDIDTDFESTDESAPETINPDSEITQIIVPGEPETASAEIEHARTIITSPGEIAKISVPLEPPELPMETADTTAGPEAATDELADPLYDDLAFIPGANGGAEPQPVEQQENTGIALEAFSEALSEGLGADEASPGNTDLPVDVDVDVDGDGDADADAESAPVAEEQEFLADHPAPRFLIEADSDSRPEAAEALQPTTESKEEIRARLTTAELNEGHNELESLSEENLAAISTVDHSLELEDHRPGQPVLRTMLLSVATISLLAVLGAQFMWQQMPIMSKDTELRPWYELACNLFGCELPPMQDLINIQTESLVVRSHPEVANSLVFNAVFRNIADFPQPFPVIQLSFTDLDSQPVASRDFLPSEYLAPALRSISNMPVGAPVQITLELMDPGEDAINYQLQFKPLP